MFADRTYVRKLEQIAKSLASAGALQMPAINRSASEQTLVDASGPEFLEALARGLRVIEAFNQRSPATHAERRRQARRSAARLGAPHAAHAGAARLCRDGRAHVPACAARSQSRARLSAVQRGHRHRAAGARALERTTGESCSAAVLDGEDVTMIAHASPQRVLPVSAQIGFRLPAFATALGRVLLAALDDRALDKIPDTAEAGENQQAHGHRQGAATQDHPRRAQIRLRAGRSGGRDRLPLARDPAARSATAG